MLSRKRWLFSVALSTASIPVNKQPRLIMYIYTCSIAYSIVRMLRR